LLNNIEIIPKFKEWALEALTDDFQEVIETKRQIQKNLQASIDITEKKLKKLTEALL
jgi:hypothetical protein